jgi:hypothetical protein
VLAHRTVALVVPLTVAAAVAAGAAGQVAGRDTKPPQFEGLASATTCIPGPIGGGRTSSYHLTWAAASDNRTPTGRIVYDVYQAGTAGGEDFSSPTYTTRGATSFDTPQLPFGEQFYFVVRARDQNGNEDGNRVEREGVNLCV